MRHSGDIEGRKLENILDLYVQVSKVRVYEYELRDKKGSVQKGTGKG